MCLKYLFKKSKVTCWIVLRKVSVQTSNLSIKYLCDYSCDSSLVKPIFNELRETSEYLTADYALCSKSSL